MLRLPLLLLLLASFCIPNRSIAIEQKDTVSHAGSQRHSASSFHAGPQRAIRQQTPSPPVDCVLTVANAPPETFQDCTVVDTKDDSEYTWYYTLSPGAGAGGTVWRGGFKVNIGAIEAGWAGFGFPREPFVMTDASAVIARKCSTCPTGAAIDGRVLTTRSANSLVPGSFPIRDATAATSPDGHQLVAAFTVDLPQSIEELTGAPFNYIYAAGPTNSSDGIQSHANGNYPYGGQTFQLKAGNLQQDSIIPSPMQEEPPPQANSSSQQQPAAEPALQCTLSIGANRENFGACASLPALLNGALKVLWNISSPSSPGFSAQNNQSTNSTVVLDVGMEAPVPSESYVALGFPATPGTMIGATAMVLSSCPTCPGGTRLQDYYLGGKSSEAVVPPGRLSVKVLGVGTGSNGTMTQGRFRVTLPADAISNGQIPVIFSSGHLGSSPNILLHHDQRGSASLDPASGSAATPSDASAERKTNAHAWLMVIGWTLLLAGAVIARSFRSLGPVWFQIHRFVQVVGLINVLAGFIIIFSALGGEKTTYTLHYNLGVAATSLGLAQLSALVVRPTLDSTWHRSWALFHHWVGRSAVLLAVANIYYGIINVQQVGSWAVISYSIVFGLIIGAGAVKEGIDYLRLPPPAAMKNKYMSIDEEREAVAAGVEAGAHRRGGGTPASGKEGEGSSGRGGEGANFI